MIGATQFKIHRLETLPAEAQRDANAMYILKGAQPDHAEVWFTGSTAAAARRLPNEADILNLINGRLNDFSNMFVVANITERNALNPTRTVMAMVLDATGDPTVELGAAVYVYKSNTSEWLKVSELKDLDAIVKWDNIQNRPNVTVVQIEQAVAKMHQHANLADLDKVATGADGYLVFDSVSYRYPMMASAPAW